MNGRLHLDRWNGLLWLVKHMLGLFFLLLALTLLQAPVRAAGPWYVAPNGNDGNSCLSPASPCANIQSAIGKASSDDTIYLAEGTYLGTGGILAAIGQNLTLSGGWNTSFISQSGLSTLDGRNTYENIFIADNIQVTLARLQIQKGNGYGIQVGKSTLNLNDSIVQNNGGGGIIAQQSTLVLERSVVAGNFPVDDGTGTFTGGSGIDLTSGTLSLNNSTISGNISNDNGGGLRIDQSTAHINNSTLSGNRTANGMGGGGFGGGISNEGASTIIMQNSLLAGNSAMQGGADCNGTITSNGYNLVGSTAGCSFNIFSGDFLNTAPKIQKLGNYYALLPGSFAIDAGNPAGCSDNLGNPFTTDQRGATRPVNGNGGPSAVCDIGAYEFDPATPIHTVNLPLIEHSCSSGVCGRVLLNGRAASGVTLQLQLYSGSAWSTLTTQATGTDGSYAFSGLANLESNQKYRVVYRNDSNTAGRLWAWVGPDLVSFLAGSVVPQQDFDIADIALNVPANGTTLGLPNTFSWQPRWSTPSDSYELDIYDPTDQLPYFFSDPLLGYVSSYNLGSLPPGFSNNVSYGWEVWAYSPDGGYGISLDLNAVTFSPTKQTAGGASSPALAIPHRHLDKTKLSQFSH